MARGKLSPGTGAGVSGGREHGQPRIWAISRYYHPVYSGAAIQGHRVLSRLAQGGFSVVVLTSGVHEASSLGRRSLALDGVAVEYLPALRQLEWRVLKGVRQLWKLARFCNGLAAGLASSLRTAWILGRRGQRHDIVQMYSLNYCSFIPVWIARWRQMHPVLRLTMLGSDDPSEIDAKGPRRILESCKRITFRASEAVISLSSALTESCRSAGLDMAKVFQIPNGVDVAAFCPVGAGEREALIGF